MSWNDIKLAKATQRIWLHSENHGIQKAVVTINDKSVDGIDWKEVSLTGLPFT